MRPPVRLAAIMGNPLLMLYTHDSIGLGEDGPTHQPVEQLSGMRAVPNLWTVRPADANESVQAWKIALTRRDGPTILVMTRQKLPIFDRKQYAPAEDTLKGAYILSDAEGGKPDLILMATGSEVQWAVGAQPILEKEGIKTRVVSMPCLELFEEQDKSYRDKVLPPGVKKRISIEAASPMGWHKWVGSEGDIIGVETYGASAPAEIIFEKYGFTVDNVVQHGLALMGKRGPVPALPSGNGHAPHERTMEKQGKTQTSSETPAEKQT
jgi:transketolase